MKCRFRELALLIGIVLGIGLFCGCGMGTTATGPDPGQTAAAEPEPTPEPELSAEEKERLERLAAQEDGFLLDKGYLYAVDMSGELLRDTYIGVLYFGEDGRYTSGSKELDRLVATVIRKHTDDGMTRMEKMRAMYDYTRDNIKYVGFGNHDLTYEPAHGKDGWMAECAEYALTNGTGNCYHFAATLAALARGIGFQAYAASGVIGAEEQQHGWVEILDENGNVWYCDPETEYARKYWMQKEYDLFYKSKDEIGQETGIGYMELKDPFEAERKEAEARTGA